jgi:hypothetical protein
MSQSKEVSLLDESNRELYSVCVSNAIDKINPEDLLLDEGDIRQRFRATVTDHELKQAFWRELSLAQKQERKMVDKNVFGGRCASSYFYSKFLKDVDRVAWLLHPISSYEDKLESILDSAISRYNDILKMDITCQKSRLEPDGDTGKMKKVYYIDTDPRKALVLLQAIKNIEDRVKGASIQKQLQIRTTEPSKLDGESSDIDMKAVDDRLKELEDKLNPYKEDISVEYVEKESSD